MRRFFPKLAIAALCLCIYLDYWEAVQRVEAADWPAAVRIGDPLILTADAPEVAWSILPASWNAIRYPNVGQVAFDTSHPGVLSICLTDSGGKMLLHHQVIVGNGEPGPEPPTPDPPPPPVTYLYGMLFYQSEDVDDMANAAEISQVILGLRLRSLDSRFQWMPTDLDIEDADGNVPEDRKPWIDMIKGKDLKMPHLFLVDQDGRLVRNQVSPTTVDGVITLVREVLPK